MNNPKQGLDNIYHCVQRQDAMWFGSGMTFWIPEVSNKRTNM